MHITCLSNGVHGKLWQAHIDCAHAGGGGEHGANGGTTEAVLAHYKLLHRDASFNGNLTQQHGGQGGCCIALLGVVLDHHALVQHWAVLLLVDSGVVGVHSVRHVSRHLSRPWRVRC